MEKFEKLVGRLDHDDPLDHDDLDHDEIVTASVHKFSVVI